MRPSSERCSPAGWRACVLRDVAEQAGVTPAAVLYYGDLDALIYETYQRGIERFSQEREQLAEQFPDARDRLRACIDHGVARGPEDGLVRCCSSAGRDRCETPKRRHWTVR